MPAFFKDPRTRRLEQDHREMLELADQSSILEFRTEGDPPEIYVLTFNGKSLTEKDGQVVLADRQEVKVDLGINYPRQLPSIRWLTGIVHPNISGGRPCLGNFVMTPFIRLIELVEMLWDMNRMATYNPYEGYGERREEWRKIDKRFGFPVDRRILRDLMEMPPEGREPEEPEIVIMGNRPEMGVRLPRKRIFSACRFVDVNLDSPGYMTSIILVQDRLTYDVMGATVLVEDGRLLRISADCLGKGPTDFDSVMDSFGQMVGLTEGFALVCLEEQSLEGVLRILKSALAEEFLETPPKREIRDAIDGAERQMRVCFGMVG